MILTLLSCRHALQQMDDYLDHELSAREVMAVRMHLSICHACEEKFAFESQFADALRQRLQLVADLEARAAPDLSTRVQDALAALCALETNPGALETLQAPKNSNHV